MSKNNVKYLKLLCYVDFHIKPPLFTTVIINTFEIYSHWRRRIGKNENYRGGRGTLSLLV